LSSQDTLRRIDEGKTGTTMKHTTLRSQNQRPLPLAWRDAELAARRINEADTCDDRVSENIFDIEDEWAEVNVIVHGMMLGAI
jgi:hypothetical protein